MALSTLFPVAVVTLLGCHDSNPPARSARSNVSSLSPLSALDAQSVSRPWDSPPVPVPPTGFRLDTSHTGRSGYILPDHPRVLRRWLTGARISSQPVAISYGGVAVGSHDGVLYAYDIQGALRWRVATGDRIYTTPWVSQDGSLYFGTDADRFVSVGREGALRVALATEDDADTSAVMAPDGSLRFASGDTLYATDGDLTVQWRMDVGGKIFSSPALARDGTVVFGSQDDRVYAVGPNGSVRWSFRTDDDVDATPMMDPNGTVYVGSDDGNFYALGQDGTLRWKHALGGFVRSGAALGLDGSVVVGTYGPRARIVAMDPGDGHERWTVPIGGPATVEYGIASSPLVDRQGNYAIGTPDDALYLLSSTGAIRARVGFPADVDSSPVLLRDGLLAVGCDDGGLYLLGD